VVIGRDCHISDSFIGPFSSVGDGSEISGPTLQHAVLLERCRILGVDRIEDSLLGRDVVVQSGGSKGLLRLSLGDDSEVLI
jgi:glucose-1-phosphate thymidylyltransferase